MKKYLDNDKGGFPIHYATGENTAYDSMVAVMRELISESSNASVKRVLSEEEIEEMRAEYTALYENDRVECEQEIAQLQSEKLAIEAQMKDARDKMASVMQRINDNVRTINDGYVVESLDKEKSFKVIVDGHVLHYTYDDDNDGVFTLARVDEVSKSDHSIFALQTNNQEAFIKLFGAHFNDLKHFVEVDTTKGNESVLNGRKLAIGVKSAYADIERDTILDSQMVSWLISDENIDSIVVYAETDQSQGA